MDATGCFGAKCKDMKNQAIEPAKKCSVTKKVNEPLDACKYSPHVLFTRPMYTDDIACRAHRSSRYGGTHGLSGYAGERLFEHLHWFGLLGKCMFEGKLGVAY